MKLGIEHELNLHIGSDKPVRQARPRHSRLAGLKYMMSSNATLKRR